MRTTVIAVALAYMVTVVLAYGLVYGTFQYNWPTLAEKDRKRDRLFGVLLSPFGLATVIAIVTANQLHDKRTVFRLK